MALFGRETQRDQRRSEAWAEWFRAQNPYALASLVLGIVSLIEFGALIIFGIAGIALGVVALLQLRRKIDPSRPAGRAVAWGGIVTSALSLVLAALLYLRVFG